MSHRGAAPQVSATNACCLQGRDHADYSLQTGLRYQIMISSIMRTIIDLPKDQIDSLAEVCRREGISRAEAIRRAITSYLAEEASAADDDAFGMWRDRKIDGVAYQRKLRREWSR